MDGKFTRLTAQEVKELTKTGFVEMERLPKSMISPAARRDGAEAGYGWRGKIVEGKADTSVSNSL